MIKLIGILILATQLSVAVETDSGFVERSFPNSALGAQQLIEFAEKAVGEPEKGVHVVVGWLNDAVNDEHIVDALRKLGIKHGLSSPNDVKAAIAKHKLRSESPTAVALAFKDRFPVLQHRKQ